MLKNNFRRIISWYKGLSLLPKIGLWLLILIASTMIFGSFFADSNNQQSTSQTDSNKISKTKVSKNDQADNQDKDQIKSNKPDKSNSRPQIPQPQKTTNKVQTKTLPTTKKETPSTIVPEEIKTNPPAEAKPPKTNSSQPINNKSNKSQPTTNPTRQPKTNPKPPLATNTLTIGAYVLALSAETDSNYNRDDYGDHNNSQLCKNPETDPYTNLVITNCHVDHVVALLEAHQSGGFKWDNSKKKQFSQYRDNHLASQGCVNMSKAGHDLAEWKYANIKNTSACNGGYQVTQSGRCRFATITLKVKSHWGLSVDNNEATALKKGLSDCDKTTTSSATKNPPTLPVSDRCTHDGRGHSFLGYNPGTHSHPGSNHSHKTGKCAPHSSTPTAPTAPPATTSLPSQTCEHYHSGNPKHIHPGANHDGQHTTGKCKGY